MQFLFDQGSIIGNGSLRLGRAYFKYWRVIFNQTNMDNVAVLEGLSAWTTRVKSESYLENAIMSRV